MKIYAKKSYYNEGLWRTYGAASPSSILAIVLKMGVVAEGVSHWIANIQGFSSIVFLQGQKAEQQQQQQPLQPAPGHYGSQPGHQELRPVSLEQQWQQFQQQVKMEGGQQQYDPYAAVTEESEHPDSARQPQVLAYFSENS